MGTKANPGPYDCYAAAEPDEPMFILLGRDRHAAALVNLWAAMRAIGGEDPAKLMQATVSANEMMAFFQARTPGETPAGVLGLVEGVAALAQMVDLSIRVTPAPSGHEVEVRKAGDAKEAAEREAAPR